MRLALYAGTRPGLAGVYNRIVRWIDGSRFSHCELVFDDGACWSSSYMDGGVRCKRIEFDPAKWVLIRLGPEFDAAYARAWFEEHDGAEYDVAGNVWFVLRAIPHSRRRWFCSEAIAAALRLDKPETYGPRALAERFA